MGWWSRRRGQDASSRHPFPVRLTPLSYPLQNLLSNRCRTWVSNPRPAGLVACHVVPCGPRPYLYIIYKLLHSNLGVYHLLLFCEARPANQPTIKSVSHCHKKLGSSWCRRWQPMTNRPLPNKTDGVCTPTGPKLWHDASEGNFKVSPSFRLSLSMKWNNSVHAERGFVDLDIWILFEIMSRKFTFNLNFDKNKGHFTWILIDIFYRISLISCQNEKCCSKEL
jgi:hypothetical protein